LFLHRAFGAKVNWFFLLAQWAQMLNSQMTNDPSLNATHIYEYSELAFVFIEGVLLQFLVYV
jgi:hypothetical protein